MSIKDNNFNKTVNLCQTIPAQPSGCGPMRFHPLSLVSHRIQMMTVLYPLSLNNPRFAFNSLPMKPALSPAANGNNLLESCNSSQKDKQLLFVCVLHITWSRMINVSVFWSAIASLDGLLKLKRLTLDVLLMFWPFGGCGIQTVLSGIEVKVFVHSTMHPISFPKNFWFACYSATEKGNNCSLLVVTLKVNSVREENFGCGTTVLTELRQRNIQKMFQLLHKNPTSLNPLKTHTERNDSWWDVAQLHSSNTSLCA